MDIRNFYKITSCLISLLLIFPVFAETNFIEELVNDLEKKRMLRLTKAKKNATIGLFTTDGCSGGMSSGWEYFAEKFPLFANHLHHQPPWLHCCITHDQAYWQGDSQNGFAKRLHADQTLKKCIIQHGIEISPKVSKKYKINEIKVRLYFRIAAELVYKTVRFGGGPCTPFEWRWGYGWPVCK